MQMKLIPEKINPPSPLTNIFFKLLWTICPCLQQFWRIDYYIMVLYTLYSLYNITLVIWKFHLCMPLWIIPNYTIYILLIFIHLSIYYSVNYYKDSVSSIFRQNTILYLVRCTNYFTIFSIKKMLYFSKVKIRIPISSIYLWFEKLY